MPTRLSFTVGIFVSILASCELHGEAPPMPAWLKEVTRVAYTDLDNRIATGDWPEKLIADLAAAKVQLFFSRAQSGESWKGLAWKSQHGDADPAMGDGDGTRHVAELCHQHGIRYLAYYWAQREPLALGEAHPDWKCVNSQGKPTAYYCVNNPDYRALVRNRIVELVAKVGVDGIFFDMFHTTSSTCYCPHCKAKFREESGAEPPVKEDFDSLLWQQWTQFKYRTVEEAMLDFNRAIKAANPEAALVVNSWNAWVYRNPHNTRNSIRVAEQVDGLLEETGWYDSVDPSFFAFPTLHNFMSWHLAGLCRQTRAFMWSSPSYLRSLPLGDTEASVRVAVMMTNGSVPAQSVPGRDVMARYMARIAERDEYFRADALLPWCGLVVSEKTELWYGRDNPQDRYLKGVYGAFQTMLERHLPVSLVTDRDLERGTLEPHRVLLLPNCAAMSEVELETVRRFVQEGGGLVATFETSFYDEHARLRDVPGLSDLFHARAAGAMDTQRLNMSFDPKSTNAVRLHFASDHPWSTEPEILATLQRTGATIPPGTVTSSVPLLCRMVLVDPLDDIRCPLRLRTAKSDPQTGEITRSDHPAIIETTYGKGRVVYIPTDLSWMYFRYGHAFAGRLLELAVRRAAAEPPPAEVAAPSIVQSMLHTQGDRLVVHLVNDISSLGRSQNVVGQSLYERREVIPIHGIQVTFRQRPRQVLLLPGEKPLAITESEHGFQVSLPPLEIHAMVVAQQ